MRAQGRTPGDEGRAAVAIYRQWCLKGHKPQNCTCTPQELAAWRQRRKVLVNHSPATWGAAKDLAKQKGIEPAILVEQRFKASDPPVAQQVINEGRTEDGRTYTYLSISGRPSPIRTYRANNGARDTDNGALDGI